MGQTIATRINTTAGLSQRLAAAASSGSTLSACSVDEPASRVEAYRAQGGLIETLGKSIGWKVGRKSPAMAPSFAPLFETRSYPSGASIATGMFRVWRMETEIAFRLCSDLPARDEAYTRAEMTVAISEMLPCFEIIDSRFAEWPEVPPLLQLADLMSHGGMVLGESVRFDPAFDFKGARASLQIGDDPPELGAGNPAGDILNLVAWLATNRGLEAGDLVTTGSYTGMRYLSPGRTAIGTIAGIGTVSVRRNGDGAIDCP